MQAKIHELVIQIKDALAKRGEMMATAESCTGGLIASSIVSEAGSSAIFAGGIVAYQNEVKVKLLGVDPQIIETYGAVSEQTVKAMAQGAIKQFDCQWAVATSGVAGPTGGTQDKPVGLVWMAVANNNGQSEAFSEIFQGNRTQIRENSVYKVLSNLFFTQITKKALAQ
ncbi:MAG: CinA family protein [Fibrobacteraceae bacterium]|nr:CinA family protein [Fibrobacteraceae bacterium]